MANEKNTKSHTGRNVTIAAIVLAALLGGGRYGLGLGGGKGGDGLLPENGSSAQGESVQVTAAPEAQAPQAEASDAPAQEADDGVLTIVVKEDKLFYEDDPVDLAALEEALLRDYVPGTTTVKLTDDHAIKSAYDEVAALLDRLGIQAG